MENDTQNTDSPHWQEIIQSNDPISYDPQLNDEERIELLEQRCLALAAQIDQQAKVVDAVKAAIAKDRPLPLSVITAYNDYTEAMAQLAKDG